MTCPDCQQAAAYHAPRCRTLVSLVGEVRYQRCYYYCRTCAKGIAPFDEQTGLTSRSLSPALERLATLAGAVGESFQRGAELLSEMAGVRLSESTVQRTTEEAGARIEALYQQGITFDDDQQWDWQHDASGQTVGYISLDATGTRQQGDNGAAAEGRMAYVGAIFNPLPAEGIEPVPGLKSMQARYVSGLYSLEQMGPLLRHQATSVGLESCQQWIAISDGGAGLEKLLQSQFNRENLVVILDFWHAASYLQQLANALHPRAPDEAKQVAQHWCSLLKSEGGALVLSVLEHWDWPERPSLELQEQLKEVKRYFGNQCHRMEYPEYLSQGWQIGSGVIESACKTVVAQRLKGAGKRWSESGAHALCHVRALLRSQKGQWEAFWNRKYTQRTNVYQLS